MEKVVIGGLVDMAVKLVGRLPVHKAAAMFNQTCITKCSPKICVPVLQSIRARMVLEQ